MADDGKPDPLNEQAKPPRRWAAQAIVVVAVIAGGIIFGAKIWQPVKRVEQRVAAPIREAVKRRSPVEDLPDLVDTVCPAVVGLHWAGQKGVPQLAILISQDGDAATTATLPRTAAIEGWLNDGQRLKVTVSAADTVTGITLLKIDGGDLPVATLGDADLPRIGSWGFALTSPAGTGCAVASGLVASDFVTDAASGDYYVRITAGGDPLPLGTPFLAADGRILGLARGTAGHVVPIDLVTTVVSYLSRGMQPPAARFGLIAEDLSPTLADRLGADRARGAVLVMVAPKSPAAKAGLQVGDVVLSAGQSAISSASELNRMFGGDKPIDLVITRGPEQTTLTVTLTPPPEA